MATASPMSQILDRLPALVTSNVMFTLLSSSGLIVVTWFLLKPKKKELVPQIPFSCKDQMHWFLGHAEMMQDMLVGLHKICVEGSPFDGLSKFELVGSTAVAVIKAEHVKAALLASNYRAKIPIIAKHMDMFLGRRSLVVLMNDEWKIMRKIMARAFNWEYLKEVVGDICSVSNVFVNALASKHGEIVDFWPLMKCITLDVIGKTAFGYDFCCCGTLTSSPIAAAFEFLLQQCMIRQFKTTLDPRYFYYNYPMEGTFHACLLSCPFFVLFSCFYYTCTTHCSQSHVPFHRPTPRVTVLCTIVLCNTTYWVMLRRIISQMMNK